MPTIKDLINAQSKEEVIALIEQTVTETGIELTPEIKEKCVDLHAGLIQDFFKACFEMHSWREAKPPNDGMVILATQYLVSPHSIQFDKSTGSGMSSLLLTDFKNYIIDKKEE